MAHTADSSGFEVPPWMWWLMGTVLISAVILAAMPGDQPGSPVPVGPNTQPTPGGVDPVPGDKPNDDWWKPKWDKPFDPPARPVPPGS